MRSLPDRDNDLLRTRDGSLLILISVILTGFLLRVWNIHFGLPYLYHPDEPMCVKVAMNIFRAKSLNPHFYHYPSLTFYLNAVSYIPLYLIGKLLGFFPNGLQSPFLLIMGTGKIDTPSVLLLGRIISAFFGTASIYVVYLIGKKWSKRTGIIASLLMALSPTNVILSHFATTDTIMTFFLLLSFLYALSIYERGELKDYLFTGFTTGLAAGSKYNGGTILIVLIVAHFLKNGFRGITDKKLYLGILASGLAFFVTTPYAILEFSKFFKGLTFDITHYATGHEGMENNVPLWYFLYLAKTEGAIFLLSLIGIATAFFMRSKKTIFLCVFPLGYVLFLSFFSARNQQTILPAIAFFILIGSQFISNIFDKKSLFRSIAIGCLCVCMGYSFYASAKKNNALTIIDSRETARIWIDQNLPRGSKIALEAYSPYIEKSHFSLCGKNKIIEAHPAWYIANKFDYLIFSAGMFKRFYDNPKLYKQQIHRYDLFFKTFDPVKNFNDGGYEIRIYQVPYTD